MLTTEHVIEMAANSGTNTPALIVCALFVWTICEQLRSVSSFPLRWMSGRLLVAAVPLSCGARRVRGMVRKPQCPVWGMPAVSCGSICSDGPSSEPTSMLTGGVGRFTPFERLPFGGRAPPSVSLAQLF